jgi:DNA-binding IclR family transcriptional regulator
MTSSKKAKGTTAPSSTGVEAVDRALKLLSSFDDNQNSLTLTDLAQKTGFYKSTVLRLAASLEQSGYILRRTDKSFEPGPELLRLGLIYQRSFKLADHIRPALGRLLKKTGESAIFSRREGNRRICMFREDSHHAIRYHVPEGSMLPLNKGATGRVLLQFEAALSSPRKLETLLDSLPFVSFGEWEKETTSIAAPVFWSREGLAGSLSIAGPMGRFTPKTIAAMTPHLLETARELTTVFGGTKYWS